MLFPQSPNEAERLFALHELAILDPPPSPAIDRICRIARQVFDVPMVFVTLLDAHRQWFKAKPKDTGRSETSRKMPSAITRSCMKRSLSCRMLRLIVPLPATATLSGSL